MRGKFFKKVKQCKLFVKYLTVLSLCVFAINCSQNSAKTFEKPEPISVAENAININSATSSELERLPHIGTKTAAKIIEHREKFGEFRRPEHLLLVAGISDKRFRSMRNLIKVR